jgi:SAM-dependent methyltransferase
MTEPARDVIETYYDARVAGKLRDFIEPLPRIEVAVQTLAEWAPANPRRVLEIGCGIGATSWRMARAWPNAEVIGADISPGSLAVASACFQRPNLRYRAGPITTGALEGEFDLIVMMDVYEHIAPSQRAELHAAIRSLLSADSRFILMIPTPEHQAFLRNEMPNGLQPVDEDIGLPQIAVLAEETQTKLLYYRKLGVWNYADYFHMVVGRHQELEPVALRKWRPSGLAAVKQGVKTMLGRGGASVGLRDYLGLDLLRPKSTDPAAKFRVSLTERRRIAGPHLRRAEASEKA